MRTKSSVLRTVEERNNETGEITRQKITIQHDVEPNYIKLYLDCLGVFTDNQGLSKSLNTLLIETLKYMSYADQDQIIYMNMTIKKKICEKTGKTIDRYNQALKMWVKEDILKRVDRSTYQVNPWLFGKGDWRDISEMRASFNFTTGEVVLDEEIKTEEQTKDEKKSA